MITIIIIAVALVIGAMLIRRKMRIMRYMRQVYSHLSCNNPDDTGYYTYTYTEKEVRLHRKYFRECMNGGLSAYKALLFFYDYLNEKKK